MTIAKMVFAIKFYYYAKKTSIKAVLDFASGHEAKLLPTIPELPQHSNNYMVEAFLPFAYT